MCNSEPACARRAKLPVSLHQPRYVILLGRSQLRVATYAFVGAPVHGDRPDRKHTPFVLKMLTANLLQGEMLTAADSFDVRPLSTPRRPTHAPPRAVLSLWFWQVEYTCRHTRESTTAAVVAEDAALMGGAVNVDSWANFGRNA